MYKLVKDEHFVNVCILSGEVNARNNRPSIDELNDDVHSSLKLLGVKKIIKGNFPNIEFNTVPHLQLVQFIEKTIVETKAEVIFTHHPADLNNDHLHTSLACQAAVRLFQRRPDINPIKELLFMEILSATDWSLNKAINQFNPNTYIEVGEEAIDQKIKALAQYRGVMRDYPHPRSSEALKGLALYRGGQAGMNYAEAFESVFRRGL
jgi:LmbE family N-acetylglucosaminyl deacetylase